MSPAYTTYTVKDRGCQVAQIQRIDMKWSHYLLSSYTNTSRATAYLYSCRVAGWLRLFRGLHPTENVRAVIRRVNAELMVDVRVGALSSSQNNQPVTTTQALATFRANVMPVLYKILVSCFISNRAQSTTMVHNVFPAGISKSLFCSSRTTFTVLSHFEVVSHSFQRKTGCKFLCPHFYGGYVNIFPQESN